MCIDPRTLTLMHAVSLCTVVTAPYKHQTPAKRESSELQCNSEMTKAPRYSERATCPDYILDILPAFHRNGETFQSVTSYLVPFALYK